MTGIKKLISAAVISAMMFSLASCGNSDSSEDGNFIYGQIESVAGNDIVLLLAEKNESTASEDKETASKPDTESSTESRNGKSGRSGNRPQNGEMPEGFDPSQFGGENMPEGFDPSQFKSRKSNNSDSKTASNTSAKSDSSSKSSRSRPQSGEMTGGFDPSQFGSGNMPEGFDPSQFGGGNMPERFSRSGGSGKSDKTTTVGGYTLTGEQKELRIPVGVTVTTSLGVKTKFDALSKGDIIKCRIEKDENGQDVVTEVWIMEQ